MQLCDSDLRQQWLLVVFGGPDKVSQECKVQHASADWLLSCPAHKHLIDDRFKGALSPLGMAATPGAVDIIVKCIERKLQGLS